MELLVENYLDLTIDEVYDVISKINIWPPSFDKGKKIKFLNSMIKYFIEKEEYEKCATLQGIIDGLENSKSTDRRS